MKDLVIINAKKEAVCSHVVISHGMNVTQHSSLELIKKYKNDLQDFGRVSFQMRPFETKGGIQKRKEYMLNRDQTIFLITLMRNNIKTVGFKKQLVKQFSEMESWIKERMQSSLEYKVMTATLQASRQIVGKETGSFHYANEAKLVNWAITNEFKPLDRESLSIDDINLLNELQTRNTVLIGAGMDRDQRKESLKLYVELKQAA